MQDPLTGGQTMHALPQFALPVQLRQPHHVADIEIRCGIGDSGDAVAAEPIAEVGQAGLVAAQRIRPGVGAAQPAVGMPGQTDTGQTRRVEDPQHSAAVLNAQRHRREPWRPARRGPAVRRPSRGSRRRGSSRRRRLRCSPAPRPGRAVADLRRADPDRVRRGRRGIQVHVVVVQAGQHGPTRCVQHVLAGPWRQGVGHIIDAIRPPGGRRPRRPASPRAESAWRTEPLGDE